MSIAGASMTVPDAPADTGNPRMMSIARKQRLQDMAFHRITQLFSLLVLVALMGIIVSLLHQRLAGVPEVRRPVHLVRRVGHHQ